MEFAWVSFWYACTFGQLSVMYVLNQFQNLYDMLLTMLEERGVDANFVDALVEFSTSYEHKQYIGFLEGLKKFAASD